MGTRIWLLSLRMDRSADGNSAQKRRLLVDFRALLYPNLANLLPGSWLVLVDDQKGRMAFRQLVVSQYRSHRHRNLVSSPNR